jgi:hypothetical protein
VHRRDGGGRRQDKRRIRFDPSLSFGRPFHTSSEHRGQEHDHHDEGRDHHHHDQGSCSHHEALALVARLAAMAEVLSEADPTDRAAVNGELGIRVSYDTIRRLVPSEVRPQELCASVGVGMAERPSAPGVAWRTEWTG